MRLLTLLLFAVSAWSQTSAFLAVGNSSSYTASNGQLWTADNAGACTGTAFSRTTAIAGTVDDTLYQKGRQGNNISCSFSLSAGVYSITLKFADVLGYTVPGAQVFNIFVNGTIQKPNFDIFGIVRAQNTAYDIGVTYSLLTSGTLSVQAQQVQGGAQLQAISVVAQGGTSSNLPFVDARTFGVLCNGVADDAPALQTAVTNSQNARILLPAGTCVIGSTIQVPHSYTTWIEGAGRSATILQVASSFSLASAGVLDFSPSQVAATNSDSGGVRSLTIAFTQPDSTNVASYTHWPPAVYAVGNNHVEVSDCIISGAWDGISAGVSSAINGISVFNVGMSFFHKGIIIDRAFDTVRVDQLQGWVYGLTANQTTAFIALSTGNYLFDLGHIDSGKISNVTSISGKFATVHTGADSGVANVEFSDIHMDTAGYEQTNGWIIMTNAWATIGAGAQAIVLNGGILNVQGLRLYNGSTSTMIAVNMSQDAAGAAIGALPGLALSNVEVTSTAQDASILTCTTSGSFTTTAYCSVNGLVSKRSPGIVYTNALIAQTAGTGIMLMTVNGAVFSDNVVTPAPAISFATNSAHSVTNSNGVGGWTYSVGAATRWFGNAGFASNVNVLPSGGLKVVGLPIYADNAAAITGGLVAGQLYRSGADPDVVSVVH